MTFEVTARGKSRTVHTTREVCAGSKRPLVGIGMVDAFPFAVNMASGDVGGPSAGLMWALGLYDLLTPGDLTGGKIVAGTGTIDIDGRVGPIGEIRDKVVAAERSGASLFLVPRSNLKELRGVDHGDMRIVAVDTFDEALNAVRNHR
jgi:PDZ domain-containing protein